MARNAGKPGGFLAAPTCIEAPRAKPVEFQANILAIDLGGSHARAVLNVNGASGIRRLPLFDIKNSEIEPNGERGFVGTYIARNACQALEMHRISRARIDGVGVVCSDSLECSPLVSKRCRGVTAATLPSERRDLWWNQGLDAGDELGAVILCALESERVLPRSFLIANDSTLVAFGDCGVVSSTGANSTLILPGERMLRNSECGALFEVSGDQLGLELLRNETLSLQDLCAGCGMPRLFEALVIEEADRSARDLRPFAEHLTRAWAENRRLISSEDLASLAWGKVPELSEPKLGFQSDSVFHMLQGAARSVIAFAGQAAALLAYFGISNQLNEKSDFTIGLDSSQARHQPGYLPNFECALAGLLAAHGARADVQTRTPFDGIVTAVSDFLEAPL